MHENVNEDGGTEVKKMTKSEYHGRRSSALRVFGIIMILLSGMLLLYVPYTVLHEQKYSTEYVTGEVTAVDGDKINIYYILPGEDEGWLVTKHGEGWKKGDKVKVFYNPDDLEEKYIEGFDEESPWDSVPLCLGGIVAGVAALLISRRAKTSEGVNKVLDIFDR